MTKFRITYARPIGPTETLIGATGIVTLDGDSPEYAARVLSLQGGFRDEMPTRKFIGFGAILQIEIMES